MRTFRRFGDIIRKGLTYGIIYADPPWPYASQWGNGVTRKHYVTMAVNRIAGLKVPRITKRDAHLYLWYTNPFVREAHMICDAWGFKYRQTITWVKTTSDDRPRMGLGYYYRGVTEHVLFATKGHIPKRRSDMINLKEGPAFHARLGRHSAKPPEFRRMIEQYSGRRSRIELFARGRAAGWDAYGNDRSLK